MIKTTIAKHMIK